MKDTLIIHKFNGHKSYPSEEKIRVGVHWKVMTSALESVEASWQDIATSAKNARQLNMQLEKGYYKTEVFFDEKSIMELKEGIEFLTGKKFYSVVVDETLCLHTFVPPLFQQLAIRKASGNTKKRLRLFRFGDIESYPSEKEVKFLLQKEVLLNLSENEIQKLGIGIQGDYCSVCVHFDEDAIKGFVETIEHMTNKEFCGVHILQQQNHCTRIC